MISVTIECQKCSYKFVKNKTQKIVTQAQKDLIDKLLLERISWRGIVRVVSVSWQWVQNYVNNKLGQIVGLSGVYDLDK